MKTQTKQAVVPSAATDGYQAHVARLHSLGREACSREVYQAHIDSLPILSCGEIRFLGGQIEFRPKHIREMLFLKLGNFDAWESVFMWICISLGKVEKSQRESLNSLNGAKNFVNAAAIEILSRNYPDVNFDGFDVTTE